MTDFEDLTELAAAAEELVTAKVARQNGISTYYDHAITRLVGDARRSRTGARRELEQFLALVGGPRFQDPLSRLRRTDKEVLAAMGVGLRTFLASQGRREHLMWAGRPLYKTVYDLAAYPMLVAELAPCTIIELGSGSGASAIWLADIAAAHGVPARIVSVDRTPLPIRDERVDFRTGDVARLGEVLPDGLLDGLARPWLVIEDAHAHVGDVLSFFDARLAPGDYLIVEDSFSKRADLRDFLTRSSHTHRLDTRYLDLFGENTTCAIDSILRRF